MERGYCYLLCEVSFHHGAYSEAHKYLQMSFGRKEVRNFITTYKWTYVETRVPWTCQRWQNSWWASPFGRLRVENVTFSGCLSAVFQCFWCGTAGSSALPCIAACPTGKPVLLGCFSQPWPLSPRSFCASVLNTCQHQCVKCFHRRQVNWPVFWGQGPAYSFHVRQTWFSSSALPNLR